MGYFASTSDVSFRIPGKQVPLALKALKDLNKRDDLKTGGSWSGGVQTEKWFSWMEPNYDEIYDDAAELLERVGFDGTHYDENGDLVLGWYDNKVGAEEHFLRSVAPFVVPGSHVDWVGEDGAHWRFYFDGMNMHVQNGSVQYGGVDPAMTIAGEVVENELKSPVKVIET